MNDLDDPNKTTIEVAVSPEVAFDAFTREIDAWFRVDPDALPDITRTAAIRFEPHLDGRLLDVHDVASGAGRQLGRITVWQPASRLTFLDNDLTEVDVSFTPAGAGTRVALTHRGLDRLEPQAAGERRLSGWAALAPSYGAHLAPEARPIGLVLVLAVAGALALMWVLWEGRRAPWGVGGLLLTAALLTGLARRHARERSGSRGRAPQWRKWLSVRPLDAPLIGLVCFVLVGTVLTVWLYGDVLVGSGTFVMALLVTWSTILAGPTGECSMRTGAASARNPSFRGAMFDALPRVLILSAVALPLLFIDDVSPAAMMVVLMGVSAGLTVRDVGATRRRKRSLGFDPRR